ncbi:hypothetical protein LEMLEM_LOCUS7924 [Lemmus lemmus]
MLTSPLIQADVVIILEDKFQQYQTTHLPLQNPTGLCSARSLHLTDCKQQILGEAFLSRTDRRTFKANCYSPCWISSELPCKKKMERSAEAFLHHLWGYNMGNDKATTEWNTDFTIKDDSGEAPELKPQKQLLRQPSKV